MSKSKSKKIRQKLIREGKLDPQLNRSFFTKNRDAFNFTTEKKSKTKKDLIYKQIENDPLED
ncbi:hypothetical protein [Priestia megaterium]|uniref:hypothetical protein n=1 Tax=Priestia megaterium TaxID=1404 RepID=UPI003101AF65